MRIQRLNLSKRLERLNYDDIIIISPTEAMKLDSVFNSKENRRKYPNRRRYDRRMKILETDPDRDRKRNKIGLEPTNFPSISFAKAKKEVEKFNFTKKDSEDLRTFPSLTALINFLVNKNLYIIL